MLTRAIFSEGCKSVAAGMNPMDLRRGINMAVERVVEELKGRAKMISTTEEIAQVRLWGGQLPPAQLSRCVQMLIGVAAPCISHLAVTAVPLPRGPHTACWRAVSQT